MARVHADAAAEALDIRLLRCFDALMADRSVSHAARRLSISQPSMSVALARLRKSFPAHAWFRSLLTKIRKP